MPKRQSSPGEVTSRPDAAGTENENDQAPAAQERTSGADGGTESAVTVGEQGGRTGRGIAAVTEPVLVEPTADATDRCRTRTGRHHRRRDRSARNRGHRWRASRRIPRPAPPSRHPSGPPAEGARPAPRPRPPPRSEPDGPDADESPTVRTAVGGSARGDDEAPTDRTPLAAANAPATAPADVDQSRDSRPGSGLGGNAGVKACGAGGEAPTMTPSCAGEAPLPAAGHSPATAWFNPVDQVKPKPRC